MKVKICGITNTEDANIVYQLGAHAIGYIFYPKSKRYVTPEKAAAISAILPFFVMKIGVFVNEEIRIVNETAKTAGLNAVQLHGDESPEYTKQINLPVIKSFRVDDSFDYNLLKQYQNCTILLDAKSDKGYGGTGQSFNYDKIPENIKHKIILAGGVTEQTIENIYKNVSPQAIDLSSAVESLPGIKDHEKLKSFFSKYHDILNK